MSSIKVIRPCSAWFLNPQISGTAKKNYPTSELNQGSPLHLTKWAVLFVTGSGLLHHIVILSK